MHSLPRLVGNAGALHIQPQATTNDGRLHGTVLVNLRLSLRIPQLSSLCTDTTHMAGQVTRSPPHVQPPFLPHLRVAECAWVQAQQFQPKSSIKCEVAMPTYLPFPRDGPSQPQQTVASHSAVSLSLYLK